MLISHFNKTLFLHIIVDMNPISFITFSLALFKKPACTSPALHKIPICNYA